MVGLANWEWTLSSLQTGIFHCQLSLGSWEFEGIDVLVTLYVCYVIGLVPYYFTLPVGHLTKCRRVWGLVFGRRGVDHADKVAIRALLLKGYYIPLMSVWTLAHLSRILRIETDYPYTMILAFMLHFMFLLDVAVFCFSYCVEHPKLGNEIKSVDPTLLGWLVALVCYPPLRQITTNLLEENPGAPDFEPAFLCRLCLIAWIVLFVIYVWATVALGPRASNLTNRGIVSSGPYRWIRHPAYAGKNIAWWLGAGSLAATTWRESPLAAMSIIGVTICWTTIYYLRAITEERHLIQDPDYVAYCEQTPYRFVPGLI